MVFLKSAVLTSLLWLSDVDSFSVTRPVGRGARITEIHSANAGTLSSASSKLSTKTTLSMAASMQFTRDLYLVLGVSRIAGDKEIRQAFRRMAKLYHPDSNPHRNTIEQFQEVNRAYEVLRDPELRKNYDMYGFDGIGTSASSDQEETKYRRGSQYNTDIRVDDFSVYDYGYTRGHSPDTNQYHYGYSRGHTRDTKQRRQPFRGECFVDVENIGMGSSSSDFFGRSSNSYSQNKAHSRWNRMKDPYRAREYLAVDSPDIGFTSHSFFGDIDETGRPRGARTKRSARPEASATRHVSWWDSASQRSDNTNSHSFFDDVIDGKPKGARRVSNNRAEAPSQNRGGREDTRPPPRPKAEKPHAGSPSSKRSESFFSRKTTTASTRNPSVSDRKPGKKAPYVGDKVQKEIKVGNAQRSFFGAKVGRRVPRNGGDILVELSIDAATATFGGEQKVLVTRLEKCDACSGNGAVTTTSTCAKCGGQGLKRKTTEIEVSIPAGSQNGSKIRLSGDGDAGPNGGPPGDLYVQIRAPTEIKYDTTVATKETNTPPEKTESNRAAKEATTQEQDLTPRAQKEANREVQKPPKQETMDGDVELSEEEQALLNKLRDLLSLRQQKNGYEGLRP